MQRRTPAVTYCVSRAAEAQQLAILAENYGSKTYYRQLARAWRQLGRDAEFLAHLNAQLNAGHMLLAGMAGEP